MEAVSGPLKHRSLTWAFLVFLLLSFANFPALAAIPALARESWVKLAHYRLDYFMLSEFTAVWAGHFRDLGLAAICLAAFLAGGSAFLAWSRSRATRPDRLLLDLGIGAGMAGLTVLGLGLAGILFTGPIMAVVVAGFVFGSLRTDLVLAVRELAAPLAIRDGESRFLLAAITLMGAVCLLVSLGPECGWDPAYYHLRLPKLYEMRHRIYFVPYIYPSHYPQGVEMLYTLAWLPGGEGAAKIVNFLFWPLCGAAVLRLAQPLGETVALRASALALTMPLVGTLAGENYVDLGLTFFQLLALRAVWLGNPIAGGVLLGFAMGSKYTGIFAVLALAAAVPACRRGARFMILFGVFALLPIAPWLAKNLLFTGDPVAPILYESLGKLHWAEGSTRRSWVKCFPR